MPGAAFEDRVRGEHFDLRLRADLQTGTAVKAEFGRSQRGSYLRAVEEAGVALHLGTIDFKRTAGDGDADDRSGGEPMRESPYQESRDKCLKGRKMHGCSPMYYAHKNNRCIKA